MRFRQNPLAGAAGVCLLISGSQVRVLHRCVLKPVFGVSCKPLTAFITTAVYHYDVGIAEVTLSIPSNVTTGYN